MAASTNTAKRRRGKNLTDSDILQIVQLIDGWSGRLTWELLCVEVERRCGVRYTRQALHRYERVRSAYSRYRATQGERDSDGDADNAGPPELRAALDRMARIEAESRRLAYENQQLLEQFARWAYNAHMRGVTEEQLNAALPKVNREQTPARPPSRLGTASGD
jgi:hypothetical protein